MDSNGGKPKHISASQLGAYKRGRGGNNFIDATGQKFNRLLVLKRVKNSPRNETRYLCLCDCGKRKIVLATSFRNGNTKSCGCLHMEGNRLKNLTHGFARTPIYRVWAGMKKRCNPNIKDKNYPWYVGRGIKVCQDWKKFENFFHDMGAGYKQGLQLDRINNNGGYSKKNCRWVTPSENGNNRRTNRLLTYKGKTKTVSQWAKLTGLKVQTILARLRYGWSVEKTLMGRDFRSHV